MRHVALFLTQHKSIKF